ncbi:MAG: lipoprotein signal peptidase [Arachidicoccus sp.]|nr:lipoprotein signal peptidase [Arachidicoccus sp.]
MEKKSYKGIYIAGFIVLLLLADQFLKVFIKTHYYLGEEYFVFGKWFRLAFVENEGMAWGWKFGGSFGKIILTLFRLLAVIWGTFFIRQQIKKKAKTGFLFCIALIYAGAAGNLIDSMFYGLVFNESAPYQNIAHFVSFGHGYANFLHGRVVDMLNFPLIDTVLPNWVPVLGGKEFTFFDPVFNLADSYISISFFLLIIFNKKFLGDRKISA